MNNNADIDWGRVEGELERTIDSIQHIGLTVEVVGNWLWPSGQTKPYAQDLREAGFQRSKFKERWFYKPSTFRASRDVIAKLAWRKSVIITAVNFFISAHNNTRCLTQVGNDKVR